MNFKPNKINLGLALMGLILGYIVWVFLGMVSGCPPDPVACRNYAIILTVIPIGGGIALGYIVGSMLSKKRE